MDGISQEFAAILGVGVAITALVVAQGRSIRGEIAKLRTEVASLRERMAHLEGLLEGLREAISARGAPRGAA